MGSIPGLGRSPGEGNGDLLQYSCLENPMDGGDWKATVHGVAELDTTEQLTHSHSLCLCPLFLHWKKLLVCMFLLDLGSVEELQTFSHKSTSNTIRYNVSILKIRKQKEKCKEFGAKNLLTTVTSHPASIY